MGEEEDIVEMFKRWTQEGRGYADYWELGTEKRNPRSAPEIHVAEALMHYLAARGEGGPGVLRLLETDPPDVVLSLQDGSRWGIECTEIVNARAVARQRAIKKGKTVAPALMGVYDCDTLKETLSELLASKNNKLRAAREDYSEILLAIYTDETMIEMPLAEEVVQEISLDPFENIDRAFLILSYMPMASEADFPGRIPVYEMKTKKS